MITRTVRFLFAVADAPARLDAHINFAANLRPRRAPSGSAVSTSCGGVKSPVRSNRLTATTYLPNSINQYSIITLPSVSQTIAPVYDANGNMTSNGKGMTLDYDEENRLKSVISNFQSQMKKSEFLYDGLGRRVERKEYVDGSLTKAVRYIYDDKLPVQELESTDGTNFTTARHYTRGLDLSQTLQGAGGIGGLLAYTDGSGSYYYSTDGNGNVTDLVDNGGVIAAHYEYSPFGEKTVTSGSLATTNPYQWSSKEYHQESGLVYYLYRYYDANQGRWLSRDPIAERGGINLYGYVNGNPMFFVDPDGGDAIAITLTLAGGSSAEAAAAGLVGAGGVLAIGGGYAVGQAVNALGESSGVYDVMAQQIVLTELRIQLKAREHTPPPPGLDPCKFAQWNLARLEDILRLRQAIALLYGDNEKNHQTEIENYKKAVEKAKKEVEKACGPCPKNN